MDTILVGLSEGRVVVESGDSDGELAHGMEGGRARIDEFLNELGESSASGPFGGETLDLLGGGDFTSEQKPKETFGKGLGSSGRLRQELLAVRNRLSSKPDTLIYASSKREIC